MKFRKSTLFLIVGVVMLLVGAIVLTIGFISVANSEETEAVIVSVSDSGNKTAYVSYHYGDNVYHNVATGYYNSNMKSGDRLIVNVDKSDPGVIVNTYFFFIFGGVWAGIGLIFTAVSLILKKKSE